MTAALNTFRGLGPPAAPAINAWHSCTAESRARTAEAISEDSIGESHNRVMIEQFRKRMGDRAPRWTETGVAALGAPRMRIEIRVVAVVNE